MTKEEMNKKFLELAESRQKVLLGIDLTNIDESNAQDHSDIIMEHSKKLIEINLETIQFLAKYTLDNIQPFSEESLVWWAFVFEHLSDQIKGLLDEKAKGLYEGIKMTMVFADVGIIKIDMSQFPGGMKK